MLLDHVIPKPPSLKGYELHRLVQGLTDGQSPLFADMGDSLIVRTDKPITDTGTAPRAFKDGDVIGFELRACVSKKLKGKHVYFPTADWRSRHDWLRRQGTRHGFEPLTVNCHASQAKVDKGTGRSFTVDQTDFVGILRVMDSARFDNAIANGIGSTARAFGFGMLVI
ncbi:MAG: type I-E CRISPR-associated protein Cas6/Cse3/CasE [Alphaproteobacteria bacterium]